MTDTEAGTVVRRDLLELTVELLDGRPDPTDDGSFQAGVHAAWEAAHELVQWLWRDRIGDPVDADRAVPRRPVWARGLDLADPRAVARVTAAQLRAVAAVLRRSSELVDGLSHCRTDDNVAQAMSDTAVHVGMSAEAIEHLVGRYLEALPPWQEADGDAERPSSDGPLVNWLAAYALGATIARHDPSEIVHEMVTIARRDAEVLEASRARLGALSSVDGSARSGADALLERAAARARVDGETPRSP